MVKIVNNNGQYKITLPKELVEAKGWDRNTRLRFVEDKDGNVFLEELKQKQIHRGSNGKFKKK
jgi:bifunctional DNA-binding transcriptional regulator/antitoxin component of YhaV-PrlF toxin-antitoxin module